MVAILSRGFRFKQILQDKMPDFCAAIGCSHERNSKTKQRGITFHRFPKDVLKREAWTQALRRSDFTPKNRSVVCSCHFKPEEFDKTGQTTRLREGVIPSVFSFYDSICKVSTRSSGTSKQAAGEALRSRSRAKALGGLDLSKKSTSARKTPRSSRTSQQAAAECLQSSSRSPFKKGVNLSEKLTSVPTTPRSSRTSQQAAEEAQRSRSPVKGHGGFDLSEKSISMPSTPRSSQTSQQAAAEGQRSHSPVKGSGGLNHFEGSTHGSTLDHQYAFDPLKARQRLIEAQKTMEELQRSVRNARDRERRHKKILRLLLDELKNKQFLTEELQQKLDETRAAAGTTARVLPLQPGPVGDDPLELHQVDGRTTKM